MSYYQENFSYKIKKKYLAKVEVLKELFRRTFPGITGDETLTMLSRCAHHYYGRGIESLSKDDKIMYDILLKNGFNPGTVYRWFLRSCVPEDIKERLVEGKLNMDQARKLYLNRKRQQEVNLGWQLMEECRQAARRLLE